jgi:hypothetical protein
MKLNIMIKKFKTIKATGRSILCIVLIALTSCSGSSANSNSWADSLRIDGPIVYESSIDELEQQIAICKPDVSDLSLGVDETGWDFKNVDVSGGQKTWDENEILQIVYNFSKPYKGDYIQQVQVEFLFWKSVEGASHLSKEDQMLDAYFGAADYTLQLSPKNNFVITVWYGTESDLYPSEPEMAPIPLKKLGPVETFVKQLVACDIPYFVNSTSATTNLNNSTSTADFGNISATTGMLIIPAKYMEAKSFSEGLAPVHMDWSRGWGFIDKTGAIIIAPQYANAYSFSEGLALVLAVDGYGFINKEGVMVVASQYDFADSFSDGFAAVEVDKKWGFINKEGVMVIAPQYYDVRPFSEGLAPVQVGNKWGFVDNTGTMIIAPQYEYAFSFIDGLATVGVAEYKHIHIDKTGTQVADPQYESAEPFSEGLAAVQGADKWGFIDKTGTMIIASQYDFADSFSEGLALIQIGDLFGFINKEGVLVIAPQYKDAKAFSEGLALVRIGDKWGFISL